MYLVEANSDLDDDSWNLFFFFFFFFLNALASMNL